MVYGCAVNRGRLLAFEGLDGCGKSTQLERLAGSLRDAGHAVLVTAEPSDTAEGRRIRALARAGERVTPEEELALFVADRRAHVDSVIEPGLTAGRVVVTDRYYLSTVAYQGARGLDPERILAESEAAFPLPDLVLLLEIDPAVGLARTVSRSGVAEPAFERREVLVRVDEIFRSLELPYVERIDAADSVERVGASVEQRVRERLGLL